MRSFLSRWVAFGGMLLVAVSASAQTPAPPDSAAPLLTAVARRVGTAVTLRWAPKTPAAWRYGRDGGYLIERAVVQPGVDPVFAPLTPGPLVPWPLERWRERVTAADTFAMVAAQMLYAPQVNVEAQTEGEHLQSLVDNLSARHGYSVFAADVSALAAEGLALRFEDTVPAGQAVLYRLALAQMPEGEDQVPAVLYVAAEDTPPPPAPPYVVLDAGDGAMALAWPIPTVGAYTAYWIDRDDGSGWRRLNTTPFVPAPTPQLPDAVFVDSTVVNYRRYTYRLTGITPFATSSAPTYATGMPRDFTPPPPPRLTDLVAVEGSTVRLSWEPADGPPAADLRGYRIGYSTMPAGPFVYDAAQLLPPSARTATDSHALAHAPNYYVVAAVDTAGNVAASMPQHIALADSTGPAPPTGLRADVTMLEAPHALVRLTWTPPSDEDLLGFRLFHANEADHVFTLSHGDPIRDTTFADTVDVHTLTKSIYYRLVALDRNFNPSDSSRMLRIVLPDIVPPAPPVFSDVTPTDSTVLLAWYPSPSTDVKTVHLLRRLATETAWSELAALPPETAAYADTSAERTVFYAYTLVAEDSTGLRSAEALPVQGRVYDSGRRRGASGLTATAVDAGVQVAWQAAASTEGRWFVVYRADGSGELVPLRSTGTETALLDRVPAGTYRYAVQVMYRDGGMSAIGEPVTVTMPDRRR